MPGKPRVVVAAGGTAGHVVPAMAVADELRASGAEVSFLGTRERIEAELVPGRRLRDRLRQGARDRPPQPAAGGRGPGVEALGAVGAARRALRRRGADVVMGGGGFVAGPAGLAAALTRHAAGADRGRQPPRPRQPAAGAAGAAGLPRLPDRGREGEPLPGHRAAGARRRCSTADRERGAGALRDRRRRALPAGRRRQPGRPLDQLRRGRGLRRARAGDARLPRPPHRRPPRLRGARASGSPPRRTRERYTLLAYEPNLGDVLAACDLVLARSGGSIFEVAAAGRPAILVPYPYATADHQSANADWMAGRRRRDGDRRRRADRGAAAAEVGGAARRRRRGWRRWRRRRAGSPSPTPPAGSPTRSWRRRSRDRDAPYVTRLAKGEAMSDWPSGGCTSSASAAPG